MRGTARKGAVVMEFSTLGYAPGVPIKIRVHVWSDNFIYTGMQISPSTILPRRDRV
ncbi:MAG: hypothetical protein HY820_08195 [Acidobacteria bacterium]|nr:hypothetical protein [Acidobacteriota bacterium]